MDRFSVRIKNVEVRSCNDNLMSYEPHTTAEIIKWDDRTCFTIASWRRDSCGYYLRFVGSRPFSSCGGVVFWLLGTIGQEHLDKHFEEGE